MSLLETRDMQATIVKQLLGEQDESNLDKHRYIDRLLEIADLESAEHQSLVDPFDRSVALVFQMFNDATLDPWDVDLSVFIEQFNMRTKDAENVDLPTCGRLIRMAWQVLHGQASTLLDRAERAEDDWEDDPWALEGWQTEFEDEEYNFSVGIITGQTTDTLPHLLDGRVKREEGRPVTLTELLMSLQGAHQDVEERRIREASRIKHAAEVSDWMSNVTTRMHKEDLEEDIRRCWEALRASSPDGSPATLQQVSEKLAEHSAAEGWTLKDAEVEGQVAGFVSALFLTHRGYTDLWQMEYPNGEIFLQDKWPKFDDFMEVSTEIGIGPRQADEGDYDE
jgi:chromatin segregation and condensation protein Rec8/ScpA/Scc1 (kleisin family)